MIEANAYLLENDSYYNEIDSVNYNGVKYMVLSNENDANDVCIRKLEIRDDGEYIAVLSKDEFDKVGSLLIEKNKDLFN